MSIFLIVLMVIVAGYTVWYINKVYNTPLKPTFVKKIEPMVEVKKEEPVVVVKEKKTRKPRAKKTTKKKAQ